MAQPGAFVPAWKRLGLKLKNTSETAANHPAEEQHKEPPVAQNGSAFTEDNDVAQNTKSKSKLGKRKHHLDAADAEGDSVKKSKHDRENPAPNGHAVAVPDVELELPTPTVDEASAADKAPLKGDPNYRKKKAGDSNYRKKGPKAAKVAQKVPQESKQSLLPPTNPRTPSLSPSATDFAPNGSTLLPSTETDYLAPNALSTPRRQPDPASKDNSLSLSPHKSDRRKSVTFTPDTKTSDGNSASNLFKKWVAEQKGPDADFTADEVAQYTEPPKVHIANANPPFNILPLKPANAAKGKKDPSRYLNYLAQYHQDRPNWKFNKAIQNDVLDNALNIFRIPEEYSEALCEYVSGLQGAGVIQRLRERWSKAIEEIDEAERQNPMDEREAMKEAALQERLSKERKRRRLDADMEGLRDHEFSEGFIRRLKRGRAEALCSALQIAMPAATTTTPQSGVRQNARQGILQVPQPLVQTDTRKVKRAKRRTDVSSDESSDSSSSEDESSSDESSGDDSSSGGSDKTKDSSDEGSTDSSDESGDSASEDDSD